MQRKSIQYQQATIFYTVTGSGPAVVLLHGFAETGAVWEHQIDFLKDKYTLIIPDIPGSGQSAFIKDATIETYAEIIKAIIEEEAGSLTAPSSYQTEKNNHQPAAATAAKATLIGHSMGGYITLAFAEKYPEYLQGFGLFHSSAFADNGEKKETRLKLIAFIKENGVQAFLEKTTPAVFTKAFAEKHPEKIDLLIGQGKGCKPEALIQYYEAMIQRPDRAAVLKSFKGPILFIIGGQDVAIPLQASLQQAYLPLQSHVSILKNAAHMGMWEEKDKANEALLNFLINQI